jgi:hypothetical protein
VVVNRVRRLLPGERSGRMRYDNGENLAIEQRTLEELYKPAKQKLGIAETARITALCRIRHLPRAPLSAAF